MPTYLFTYVAGGAGHVGRSLTIANYLREIESSSKIVFAGAKVGERLVKDYGFDYVRLDTPDYFRYGSPNVDASHIVRQYLRNLGKYSRALDEINPDVAVSDMEPFLTFFLRFKGLTTVVITHEMIPLWVDDISPAAKCIRDRMRFYMYRAAHAIIYPDIMGLDEIPPVLKSRCLTVGPLAYERYDRAALEGERKILVVPSNTGEYTQEFIRAMKDENHTVYIRSNGSSGGNHGSNVRFLGPAKNLMSYICSSDIVLCSGYSTIMEAVACNKPVVIYPKTEEQRIVGRLCEKRGIALYAETHREALEHINSLFKHEALRKKITERQASFGNGALEAARFLVELARGKRPEEIKENMGKRDKGISAEKSK